MTKKLKRILAILLTLSMVMSMVSMTSLALEEEEVTVTLTYNANAGEGEVSGLPADQEVECGTKVTIGSCGTRAGYNALGWSTDPEAKTADSTFAPDKTYVLDSDVTLYAVWKVVPEEEGDGTVKVGSYEELTKAISDAGTTPTTIKLTQSVVATSPIQIKVGQEITITSDTDGVTLSRGEACTGLFVYNNEGTLTLQNIVIDGANVPAKYAAIYNNKATATTTIINSVVQNCVSTSTKTYGGGGVFNNKGTLTITGTTIQNNHIDGFSGGGVYSLSGTLTITDSTFTGNTAGKMGGGVYSTGTHTITGGTFSGNKGGNKYGGAVYSNSKAADNQIKNTVFTDSVNGAVAVSGGTLEGLTITGTTGNGPALKLSGTVTVTGCTITDNENKVSVIENGGAVYCPYIPSAEATFNNCTIADNTGVLCGGLNVDGGKATLLNTVIKNNTATSSEETVAGGIYVTSLGKLTFQSGALYNNGSLDLFRDQSAGDLWVMPAGKMVDPELAGNYFAAWNYAWQRNGELSQGEIIESVQDDYVESHEVRLIAVAQAVPETEVKGVYLYTEGNHTGGETANTLAEAVELAKDNNLDTVYVCGNVDVTNEADVNALNSGIHFVRCQEHPNGYMFTIKTDAELSNAHIDGNQVPGDAALIYVSSEGKLTISGTTVIENGNNANDRSGGGAIDVGGSSLTMTGGTITGNRAQIGGGIYAHSVNGFSHGSKVAFEGGIISNNTATGGWGGGALIEDSTSDFGVNGGRTVFDGNVSAGLGGGVFLRFGMHRIYKATFSDNQANRANSYYDGGAIYIEEYTVAHMKNVFVSGSTTNRNGAAAVAVCPTGELAVYELEGLLSANNQSDMMDIGTIQGGITSAIPKVYLPSHVIGGGEVSYTKSNGTPMDISGLQFVEGFFSLKTVIPANDEGQVVANAKKIAEKDGVVITGNHANEFGAGIMTNGVLKIGTETTTLRVNKVWADGEANHENDQILVYLTQDGKPVSQGFRSDSSVILNKDNNWSYVWSNLGDYETFKWGVKEASVDGYTSEAKVEKDTEYSVIADKYYVATLTNTPNTEAVAKSLVINKTAIGLDPDASYKFTLKLDNVGDGAYAIQLPDGTLNPIFNNEITFYMKDGQSAVVKGLPEGYTYEVTEAEGDYVTHVLDSETLDETGSITVVDVVNIAKTSLTVNKVWDGDDDTAVRPTSILVDLMNGETLVESAVVEPDAEGNWKYIFDDLPMYDAAGDKIAYTVAEVEVPANYTSSQVTDGTVVTITNTYEEPYTPPTITYTSLTVNKVWAGDDGETRPDSVTVQLYRNGAAYGQSRTLNEANSWSTIWTSLNDDYTWTVEEVNVPEGYTASQSRRGTTVTITNTFTEDVEETDTPTTETPAPTESPEESEDLGDNDTPLTELPEETETPEPTESQEPEEGEDLGDNDTPLAEVPQTGDMLWLWMTLAAGSAVSLAWISAEEKKGKRVSK